MGLLLIFLVQALQVLLKDSAAHIFVVVHTYQHERMGIGKEAQIHAGISRKCKAAAGHSDPCMLNGPVIAALGSTCLLDFFLGGVDFFISTKPRIGRIHTVPTKAVTATVVRPEETSSRPRRIGYKL